MAAVSAFSSSSSSSSGTCANHSTNCKHSFPQQHLEDEDGTSLDERDPPSTAHLLPLRKPKHIHDECIDLHPPLLSPLLHVTFDQDHRCSSTSGKNHRLVTCDDDSVKNTIPVRNSKVFEAGMDDHGGSSSVHSDLIGSSGSTDLQNPNLDYNIVDHRQYSTPSLLHVAFNQDYGCFAAGMGHGFRIHNCDPFREIFRRDFDSGGGIGVVEMLFRCNILALVGGGPDPQYPPNKVMIWDDHESRCIGELSFRSEVRAVRLRRYRIVVVLEQKILVHNFSDLKLLHQIETISNRKGLCAISQLADSMVLVCPGLQKGQVRVEHYASKRTRFIMAHDSRIACFALTQDGNVLATASTKGTLVRVFNTADGSLLQELRRGADRAEIYSLAFSPNAQWLVVSSDKGTVHVFSLKNFASPNTGSPRIASHGSAPATNAGSLSFIKGVLPKYFRSEWSVAQFRVVEGAQYIAGFGLEENTVVIVGADGSFYKCEFDPINGGEMSQLVYHNFLKPEDAF